MRFDNLFKLNQEHQFDSVFDKDEQLSSLQIYKDGKRLVFEKDQKLGEGHASVAYLFICQEIGEKIVVLCEIDRFIFPDEQERKWISEAWNIVCPEKDSSVYLEIETEKGLKKIIVLPYLEGKHLDEYLSDEDPFRTIKAYLGIIKQIQSLHRKNLAHNDIKVENVLVKDENILHLIDFEHARYLDEKLDDNNQGITRDLRMLHNSIKIFSPKLLKINPNITGLFENEVIAKKELLDYIKVELVRSLSVLILDVNNLAIEIKIFLKFEIKKLDKKYKYKGKDTKFKLTAFEAVVRNLDEFLELPHKNMTTLKKIITECERACSLHRTAFIKETILGMYGNPNSFKSWNLFKQGLRRRYSNIDDVFSDHVGLKNSKNKHDQPGSKLTSTAIPSISFEMQG